MRALMVGCGNMGGALLAQWADLEGVAFEAVAPSRPAAAVPVHGSIDAVVGEMFDAIVIAVKPQMIDAVMPAYEPLLRSGGLLISIAAGTTIAHLQSLFPDAAVVRTMPNLSSKVGRGVTGLVGVDGLSPGHREFATRLAAASGEYLWVDDEEALDRLTAISGCGSGYAFQFIESFEAAARSLGFNDAEARMLVRQTLLGAAEMAMGSEQAARDLKQAVMSKRGVTEAGIARMTRDNATDTLMTEVVAAAFARAREMAAETP